MLKYVMKHETWEKTPLENFQEVFHEVRSLLMHYILEDFQEDFPEVFQNQIQILKTYISIPISEKPAYLKTF